MSRPIPPPRTVRPGFSLMEILVVLAIFGLATAIIMPSTSRMLDQAMSHAVFFEFQRQVSDLRREASRTGVAIRIADPEAAAAASTEGETTDRVLTLRSPWRYTMAPALEIAEGGACSPTSVNLARDDVVVMTLRSSGTDCRFTRLIPAAPRQGGPSSR